MYKDQFVLCWSLIVPLENFEAVGNYHWFIENCLLPALTFKEQPRKMVSYRPLTHALLTKDWLVLRGQS
jgi:hypothetical protein